MDIREAEIFDGHIDIRYTDGSREEISGGIYERKNTAGDTVEQRPATDDDTARLSGLALAFEAEVKPLDGIVAEIDINGDAIDVLYADGRKESLEAGIYEIKDASGDTIFERAATEADSARLFSLELGGTGAGAPTDDNGTGEPGDDNGGTDDPGDDNGGDNGGTGEPADDTPANIIDGSADDDRLKGTDGDDDMSGGDGDDRLRGRDGNDDMDGGNGDDRLRGDEGDDTLAGGEGNDRIRGDKGSDTVSGDGGDDRVRGGAGDDMVFGGDGSDRVRGDGGNDQVFGGGGDDRVKGGAGDDTVDGGAGSDIYHGGLGADVFVFEVDGAADRIKDFEDGVDLIDLSAFGVADATALTLTQVSENDVLIDLGNGDTIRVDDVTVAQLTDDDFLF